MVPNFPQIIQQAQAKLKELVTSHFFLYGRSKGIKAMKGDYAERIMEVLSVMIQACCLEFDGGLCRVSKNRARPLTVPEIAYFSKLKQRTVERILHDLKDLGLIQSEPQFKRYFPQGLKVASVWRVFTRKFWEKLGLWDLFVESVKYATQYAHLKLKHPLKTIDKKKPPNLSEEQIRRSKQNNLWFATMIACEHRPRAQDCAGGHQCAEICVLCRQFPN